MRNIYVTCAMQLICGCRKGTVRKMTSKVIDKLRHDLITAIDADDSPSLSVETAAKILGQDKDCLRESIANGTCPFGFGGRRLSGQRYAKVSKLALWNFLNKGVEG